MNRIDRLVATLIHLQSKRIVKAEEIARRFEISLRTVYRDIRSLEEAGVPIGAEPGKGYYIAEGYHLPPVIFDRQEAAALVTGEKLLEKFADASVAGPFSSAIKKIRSVLRGTEKEFLEKLEKSIAVYRSGFGPPAGFPNQFAAQIHEALAHHNVLEIEYYAYHTDTIALRNIEPMGLCFYGNAWHLLGWCRLRKDYRDFRTDRIKSLTILDEVFENKSSTPFEDYFEQILQPKDVQKVVARFKNEAMRYMGEQKYYFGCVDEKRGETETEMTFYTSTLDGFAHWLLAWSNSASPISPDALKIILAKKAKEAYEHYCGETLVAVAN